jgi:hypothetical protein
MLVGGGALHAPPALLRGAPPLFDYYFGSAEGHEYPDLQVGDEVNTRRFFSFESIRYCFF